MAVSVNQDMVDTIAGDEHWNSATITYVTDIESAGAKNQDLAQQDFGAAPAFQRISPADELALEEVAELWDELIAPSIVEINNSSANITVDQVTNIPSYEGGVTFTRGNADAGTLASAGVYLEPRPLLIGSDYDWTAAVHEFGHALGLQHPGSYNASPGTGPTYENNRTYDEDTGLFSIMSYFQPASYIATVNWSLADIRTPMIYDILAIQQIYGVDTTTRTGDTTYGFNTKLSDFASADEKNVFSFTQTKTDPTPIPTDGSSFNYIIDTKAVFTIWDAGGDHDRIDASLFTADQRIDLNPGTYSDIGETTGPDPLHPGFVKLVPLVDSIGIAFGVTIEEAIGGSGNDTITGNSTDNYLDGGAGNDVLSGGLGDDTLLGGIGDDTLSGGFGTDHLDGGADNDTLDGGGSLDGGGASSGPDLLTGGAGDDTFIYQRGYRATTITDFNKAGHDALDLTSTKIHNFSDLLAIGTQSGADLVFDLGATTTPQHDIVTLQNTTKDDLDPADFDFVEEVGPGYAPFRAHQDSIAGFVPHSANVVALSGGGFATVEARFGGDLFLFTYDEKGAELSSSLITTSSNQGFVVANLAPAVGGFVVAWAQTTTPFDYSINAQIFDGAGHAIAPAFQVNTTPIPTETPGLHTAETTFASAGDTGFTIEWKADLIPGSTPNATVLGRSFDNNGVALTSDTVLATTLNDYDPTGQRAHPGLYSYTFPNHTGLIIEHLTTTAEFGTEQRWFGRLTGSLDPIELPFLGTDGPFNVAQLDDGRIALTWVHFEQVGFSQFYGDPMLAILDSDLKGYSISGSSGDDRLVGGSYNDRLFGLDGNDTLIGGAGPDLLDGGSGTDTVSYYSSLNGVDVDLTRTGSQVGGHAQGDTLVSIENITGSSYDDTLKGDAGVNVIYGGYGADVIVGGGDADELHGQQGDDQITLNGNNGTAWGDAGNDIITLLGDAGAVAHGGNGNDEIDILGNGASAFGDGGQDTYVINGDNNYVDDLGDDELLDKFFINGNNNQVFGELGPNSFRLSYLSHSSGNMLFGGPGDDTFENLGDGDTNTFYGGEGADTITGGVGNDLIFTDEFYPPSVGDVVHADAGDDQVVSKGNQDLLDGGPGTDTLTLDLNWFPGDILVTFDEHSQQFTMPDGTVAIGFENVEINMGYGTNTVQAASYTGSLVLRGDSGGAIDIFETGSGNDRLYGSGFNNILKAGEGDDYFNETGVGANLIEGGAGHNSLSYEYVYGGIYADLANERVYSKGNGGGFDSEADLVDATTFDTVRGIEKIYGGYYNDQIRGSTADETFLPGHGNDGVVGGGGRDTVDYSNADYAVVASLVTGIVTEFAADNEIGKRFDTVLSMDHVAGISNLTGSGNDDDLTGDHADNVITGGRHDDLLTGNGGADIFVYRDNDGTDTLTDFAPGVDRIDLTGVVGKYELADLNIFQDGANTVISFEPIQGAGFAAFAANEFFGSGIVLENVQMGDLTERDFIFASRPSENQAPVAALTNTVVTDEDIASAPVAIGASDPDGDTLSYAIKSGFGPTAGTVGFANGGFTYTPNANANGSDTFTIVIDDGHGGRVEQVVSVTINPVNDAPVAAATNAVVTNEDTTSAPVAIGASDVDGDTLSYTIKSGFEPAAGTVAFANGSFTYAPHADASGPDTFAIVIDDGHGGTTEQVVSVTINTLDTSAAAPSATLATDSGLAGDGITNVGTVDVSGLATSATWQYAVNGGNFITGTGTSVTLTGDGPKAVLVHQTDAAGNVSANASLNFTLDTVAAAPAVALATDSGVVGDRITKVSTVNVSGLEAGASWEYAVNGGSFIAGTGTSVTLSGDGPKAVLVHQIDTAGNVSADASLNFTLDTVAAAPAVALATDSGVVGDRITKVGTVNVSGLEAGASWEYAVNGGSFIVGTGTSVTLSGDGPKTVLVHQTDTAGIVSANASLNFTLDTAAAAPSVSLATDSGLVGDDITRVGTVNVSGLEAGASWEYAVNGGSFVTGTGTSFTLTGDGPKTVLVHQSDAAGNVSANASLNFTLDTVAAAPAVALATDSGVVGDRITKVSTVNVSGLEAGARWEYAVNGGSFIAGTGTSVTLSGDGPKTVLVHQIDTAGNVSADASLNFTLDTTAAAPSIALATDSGVAGDGITKTGTVNVTGLEAGATWQYAVNGGAFVTGTAATFTLTGDGPKAVLVHQTDTADNVSADASLNFTLDTTAPLNDTITTAGATVTNPVQSISGTGEAGTTIQLQDGAGAIGPTVLVDGSGHWSQTITLSGAGSHAITAIDTDAAGNASTSNAITFTLNTGDIIASPGQIQVSGTAGVDHIVIGATNLLVDAGNGDDTITIGSAGMLQLHILNGGDGSDTLDLFRTTTASTIDLRDNFVFGSQVGLNLLSSIENVRGGSGDDTIIGSNGANQLEGGAGQDTITGGGGNDTIIGGIGNDHLTGSAGDDNFVFRPGFGHDTITDFNIGTPANHDVLDLRGLGFTSVQDVLNHTDPGANAVIHAGIDDVTLQHVTKAQLALHTVDIVL